MSNKKTVLKFKKAEKEGCGYESRTTIETNIPSFGIVNLKNTHQGWNDGYEIYYKQSLVTKFDSLTDAKQWCVKNYKDLI